MKNGNYFCIIYLTGPLDERFEKREIFMKEYKHIKSAYHGEIVGYEGFFYLASHPVTNELIMRYDFLNSFNPAIRKKLACKNIEWDEVKFF